GLGRRADRTRPPHHAPSDTPYDCRRSRREYGRRSTACTRRSPPTRPPPRTSGRASRGTSSPRWTPERTVPPAILRADEERSSAGGTSSIESPAGPEAALSTDSDATVRTGQRLGRFPVMSIVQQGARRPSSGRSRPASRLVAAAVGGALAVVLSACSPASDGQTPTPSDPVVAPPTPSPTPSPTEEPS